MSPIVSIMNTMNSSFTKTIRQTSNTKKCRAKIILPNKYMPYLITIRPCQARSITITMNTTMKWILLSHSHRMQTISFVQMTHLKSIRKSMITLFPSVIYLNSKASLPILLEMHAAIYFYPKPVQEKPFKTNMKFNL